MQYGYVLGELLGLFLLSQSLTRTLSSVLYSLTRRRNLTIYFLALFFLPGTIVHEIAHYMMAIFLRVPAGNMKLFPKAEGDVIKLGSVDIGITDPFRRMLIGVAPFLIGTAILVSILYLLITHYATLPIWLFIISIYGIFEIGNTMFSSKKDLEGTVELLIGFIAILVVLFFLHIRLPEPFVHYAMSQAVLQNVTFVELLLLIPLGIDIIIILIFVGLKRVLHR